VFEVFVRNGVHTALFPLGNEAHVNNSEGVSCVGEFRCICPKIL